MTRGHPERDAAPKSADAGSGSVAARVPEQAAPAETPAHPPAPGQEEPDERRGRPVRELPSLDLKALAELVRSGQVGNAVKSPALNMAALRAGMSAAVTMRGLTDAVRHQLEHGPDPAYAGIARALAEAAETHRAAVGALSQQLAGLQGAAVNLGFGSQLAGIASAIAALPPAARPPSLLSTAVGDLAAALRAAGAARPIAPAFDPSALRETLAAIQRMPPGWSQSLAGIAVDAAGAELAINEPADVRSEIERVVGDALDEEIDAAAVTRESAATPTSAAEVDLAALTVRVWASVVSRLPALSENTKLALLQIIASVLLVVYQEHASAAGDRQVLSALQAEHQMLQQVRDELRRSARPAPAAAERRLVATRELVLRENPDAKAARVGTLAAGAVVVVREQAERWLYVAVEEGRGARAEGWVYFRNLRPASPP